MGGFQRARSAEQRAERRRTILDTASAMLAEMPLAAVSLNELARRVGLAKSNVLRYFESREAVLLELLDTAWGEWLAALAGALETGVDPGVDAYARAEQVAVTTAATLGARPVLCDLLGAQAGVLERNVSADVAARYKRAALGRTREHAGLLHARLPELGPAGAERLAAGTLLVTGAVWTHARPSEAMLQAYRDEPELSALRLDVDSTLVEVLAVLAAGMLARNGESIAP
jgi:AcrR family transcriptional regulator